MDKTSGWLASVPRAAAMIALAVILYGLFSRPAPAGVGPAEAMIGLLLAAAIGPARMLAVASGSALAAPRPAIHVGVGTAAFAVLIWLPLARGLASGADADDLIRDLIPLGFLFLPVLLAGRLAQTRAIPTTDHTESDAIAGLVLLDRALIIAGVACLLRWWAGCDWTFSAIGTRPLPMGQAYLLNSGTVLYAVLRLSALATGVAGNPGGSAHTQSGPRGRYSRLRSTGGRWLAGAGALLGTAAYGATVHRFALSAILVGWLLLAARPVTSALRRLKARTLRWCAAIALLAGLWAGAWAWLAVIATDADTGSPVAGLWTLAWDKTGLVGINRRDDEAAAVIEQIGHHPFGLLFGDGWGALIANPAVGGMMVSYTHSLATYLLLKSGLIGLAAAACYLATFAPLLTGALRQHPALVLPALAPLAAGLTVHTGFKYMCFGLLLTLIAEAGATSQRRVSAQVA